MFAKIGFVFRRVEKEREDMVRELSELLPAGDCEPPLKLLEKEPLEECTEREALAKEPCPLPADMPVRTAAERWYP